MKDGMRCFIKPSSIKFLVPKYTHRLAVLQYANFHPSSLTDNRSTMPDFSCDQCDETFTSRPILSTHTSNYHSLSLTCNKVTLYQNKLTGEFECQAHDCEHSTKNRTDMQNHLRRAHINPQCKPSCSSPYSKPGQKRARRPKKSSPHWQPSAPQTQQASDFSRFLCC